MFTLTIRDKKGNQRTEQFDEKEVVIGRVPGNNLVLRAGNISRQHARIAANGVRLTVSDLGSSNGTFVNGRRIRQPTILRDGDEIWIGDFYLRVELPPHRTSLVAPVPREPRWYVYGEKNGTQGPMTTSQVSDGIQSRSYTKDTQICREGSNEWQSLGSIDFFASTLESTAEPPVNSSPVSSLTDVAASHLLTDAPDVYWYILDGDSDPMGPYTTSQVRHALMVRQLATTVKVNRAGTPDWSDLASVPEFSEEVMRVRT